MFPENFAWYFVYFIKKKINEKNYSFQSHEKKNIFPFEVSWPKYLKMLIQFKSGSDNDLRCIPEIFKKIKTTKKIKKVIWITEKILNISYFVTKMKPIPKS